MSLELGFFVIIVIIVFYCSSFKTSILLQMCKWFIVKEAEMLFVLVYVNIHNNEPL